MATKVLSNEFMQNIATEEAWKVLSSDFAWSEAILEKYQDKVDWDEISECKSSTTIVTIFLTREPLSYMRSSRPTSRYQNYRLPVSGEVLSSKEPSN